MRRTIGYIIVWRNSIIQCDRWIVNIWTSLLQNQIQTTELADDYQRPGVSSICIGLIIMIRSTDTLQQKIRYRICPIVELWLCSCTFTSPWLIAATNHYNSVVLWCISWKASPLILDYRCQKGFEIGFYTDTKLNEDSNARTL